MALITPEDGPFLVASHNAGKIWEIRELMEPFGFAVTSAKDKGLEDPEETGTTFEENAAIKALAALEATGLTSLSDDSGLAIAALNGDPGIYSARWAGEPRDFARAMRNVEEKLQAAGATTPDKRRATFVAVLCLARPDTEPLYFRGEVDGTIVWPPRGDKGFGYDPIFLPDGESRTFGEMMSAEKHAWVPGQPTALSHRARAFQKFAKHALGVE
ncbi:RdgB/HAM1 family non-canonical purine NTP pyrophosphatase [Jiella sp. MQZ9-1]|uniref:dITP/XTP pyrophosphatase n=1 Tax=Jiella flava TaxID=2816857 RepID=A0A939FUU1_9HYPH|nr:RdgB/HAM1 family non-canonical purine NTP pyrophosphatase [Jiella flava]MBO0661201.1 RdgB/HAM1 family non-canonical purine NTP pyrophosphatase [Jiella flava]MCD2469846.1 RdgB/HAM1 family non-canonical purine NTP pyrophosphatase [Jiella flava]